MVDPQQLKFFKEAGLVCEYTDSKVLAPFPNPTWSGKRLGRVANKTLYRVWFIKIFQHNNSHANDKISQYTVYITYVHRCTTH